MDEALEYDALVQNYWKFLHTNWPIIDRVKHHRTEIAAVNDIDSIKSFVLNRLGAIPVFFFLTVIFGTRAYSCPYRNVEKSRHLAAESNPDPFKYVTLNLDGHDSRVIYVNADKASMYSYKLKKSGFRVQVCTDMNNMVLFVSAPAPCKDYNDGTMLLRMGIQNKIHKLDCVALDGGYNLFIGKLLDSADELQYENF
ncbi:hypothetical protein BGZ96_009816 [Linnemannia gamsii]|uniref:DDE Tnp4 domain-containing protein n=1 Tax=Linnemannia gamsii TaxID=64522 RepID=A0ABQ7JXE8_9FUNG|nr:hypothetical protein BGZ96_009816 [Linnemannia gamsii]